MLDSNVADFGVGCNFVAHRQLDEGVRRVRVEPLQNLLTGDRLEVDVQLGEARERPEVVLARFHCNRYKVHYFRYKCDVNDGDSRLMTGFSLSSAPFSLPAFVSFCCET